MTQPPPPPPEEQPPPPPPEDVTAPEADGSHLIPILATILAAYLAYKASKGAVKGSWQLVSKTLGLPAIAGAALTEQAERAIVRQYAVLPKYAADPLWMASPAGVKAGQDAGYQQLVDILRHTDSIAETTPRDISEIADSVARTVSFAAVEGAARAADQPMAAQLEAGAEPPPTWHKRWKSRHDLRVRYTHAHLDGVSVPVGQSFVTLDGNDIRYPHDPRAPMAETAGCRCRLDVYAKR